jgi:isochorismate hydrolase
VDNIYSRSFVNKTEPLDRQIYHHENGATYTEQAHLRKKFEYHYFDKIKQYQYRNTHGVCQLFLCGIYTFIEIKLLKGFRFS